MNVRFLSDARAELDGAALYYERACPGLGDDFHAEIDAALGFVRDFPEACPPSAHGCRRRNLHRFPYFLIYAAEDDEIAVAAVSHVNRDPAYWHTRLV